MSDKVTEQPQDHSEDERAQARDQAQAHGKQSAQVPAADPSADQPADQPAGADPASEEQPSLDDAQHIDGPDLIVITGMSGAGRTEAMHTFEDLGYYCIDSLPPKLLVNLVSLAGMTSGSPRKLAVVCDLRAKELFGELTGELRHLQEIGLSYTVIFLDASDEVLLRRFRTSRRRHPMAESGMTIVSAIRREREMLVEAKEIAKYVIDTSDMRPRDLRMTLRDLFSKQSLREGMSVQVFSFGFKHGAPLDADIVIDVRFLPNPFYEPNLRTLTGLDEKVKSYVLDKDETRKFIDAWHNLLDVVMPGYVEEGKQHLSIGVGCTGGQHRSVVLAEETGAYLKEKGYSVAITHRDIALAEVSQ